MSASRSAADLAEIAERVRTPDNGPDREELIAAFAGGAHEIRVSVIDAGGRFAIEVRVFRCQEDGEYRATRHGLRLYRGQISRVVAALLRAERVAARKTTAAINANTPKGTRP